MNKTYNTYRFYFEDWYQIVKINADIEEIKKQKQKFSDWYHEQLKKDIPMDADNEEWINFLEKKGYKLKFIPVDYDLKI